MNNYLKIDKTDLFSEWIFLINIFRQKFYDIPYTLIEEHYNAIDFRKLIVNISNHKLLLLLYDSIFPILTDVQKIIYKKLVQDEKDNIDFYINQLRDIMDIIYSNNINKYMILKGLPLSQKLYGSIYTRGSGDIDILLRTDDCITLCDILTNEYGFFSKFALKNRDINHEQLYYNKKAIIYGYTHEIPLVKIINNRRLFSIELKNASSAIDFSNIHNVWENKEIIPIDKGFDIVTTNSYYDFVHLVNNAFCNTEYVYGNKFSLRDYFDICTFVNRFSQNIDWSVMINEFTQNHSLSKAKIVFKYLNEIIPDYVSKDILDYFLKGSMNAQNYEYLIEKMFFPKYTIYNNLMDEDLKYKTYIEKTKYNYYSDPLFKYKVVDCNKYINLDKYMREETVFTHFFYKQEDRLKINFRINSSLLENIQTFYIEISFLNLPNVEEQYVTKQTVRGERFKPVNKKFLMGGKELEANIEVEFYDQVKDLNVDYIHYRYNLVCNNVEIERNYNKNAGLDIFYSVKIK